MNDRSDENLVMASRKGDESAYALLVRRHYKHVFIVCLGVAGNIEDAEDATQEAMLKGYVQLKKLRNTSQFGSWVDGKFFRIMKDVCMDWQEKYRRDEPNDRDCVFVTARNPESNQSYEFQFDLETKLPVRGKVWQNSDFEGEPNIEADKIVYNPILPQGVFDFEIPNAAKVIDRAKD